MQAYFEITFPPLIRKAVFHIYYRGKNAISNYVFLN